MGLVFGLFSAAYGVVGIWLGYGHPDEGLKRGFCKAWLCPLEFSPERLYDLHSRSGPREKEEAISELKRALRENPASAYAWADLGEVLASGGDAKLAQYSIQRAVAAAPNSPAILMRAANVAISAPDYESAMTYSSQILRDPEAKQFYPAVFLLFSRVPLAFGTILDQHVRPTPGAAEALLSYAIASRRSSDAEIAWDWLVKHGLQADDLTRDYLHFLTARGQENSAAETWAALNAKSDAEYRRSNWIFNGGFEEALRPVPLDWQIDHPEDVQVLRSSEACEGKWSLEVQFQGTENVQFEAVREQTTLAPGKWRLSAAIRTDSITTDEGVAMRVFDARQSRRLDATTDALTGTHGWTRVERIFDVQPETKLVGVEIFRRSSERFDNKIAGTAWVDAVALTPVK